jgi:microcystin-dependent protein
MPALTSSGGSGGLNAQTTDYTIIAADAGKLVTMNAATTKTIALTAAATLTAGFTCRIKNVGTANVTIDPAGSELIEGASTATIQPGRLLEIVCDGAGFLVASASTAVGSIHDYGGGTVPAGFLLCFGQNVSRSTYKWLFAAWGTTHGTGDGSTTFGVIDLRGRASFGQDNMGGTAAGRISNSTSDAGIAGQTLGSGGGSESRLLSTVNLPTTAPYALSFGGAADGASASFVNSFFTGGGQAFKALNPGMIVNKMAYTGVMA